MSIDDQIIETPDGPMTYGQWKKKNPVQIPSRRTKGKDLPVKIKRFTEDPIPSKPPASKKPPAPAKPPAATKTKT